MESHVCTKNYFLILKYFLPKLAYNFYETHDASYDRSAPKVFQTFYRNTLYIVLSTTCNVYFVIIFLSNGLTSIIIRVCTSTTSKCVL